MKVLCNLTDKKIEGFSRWDEIPFEPSTHIVFDIDYIPDMETERLNDTNDGLRPITQVEIDAEADAALDDLVDFTKVDPFLKAYVLAVNDGSIVPGSNMAPAEIKAAVKAKL